MQPPSTPLLDLQNDHIRFSLRADCSGELLDKASGRVWRLLPVALQENGQVEEGFCWLRHARYHCEVYPGRFRAVKENDGLRITLLGRQGHEIGTFRAVVKLDGPWIDISVPQIDDSIPSLVFPPPLESPALVLPMRQGVLQRDPIGKFGHEVHRFSGGGLNMRWFGGLSEHDNGWMCIVQDGAEDAAIIRCGMNVAPLWTRSLGAWNSPRHLRYRCTAGGYVGQAKIFRRWAQENGMFRTLKEKIAEVPAVAKLIGGRNLSFFHGFTYKKSRYDDIWMPLPESLRERDEGVVTLITYRQAAEIIEDAKRLGMRRGIFNYHGWIKGGYDETHPDIWPPEPAFGTAEELRALCHPPEPFIACLHDNYQDMYEQSASFPQGICRMKDGALLPGGFWRGGQAYILTGQAGLEYAQRNWPHLAWLGAENIYSDTLTAEILKESWEPGRLQSRAQDLDAKRRTLAFFKSQGVVFSSELGCDFGVPWLDAVHTNHPHLPGTTIPLWSLVYHDCVVALRSIIIKSHEDDFVDASVLHERCRQNMLWGYTATFGGFTAATWPSMRQAFAESLYADEWHQRIGTDEMLNHRFLTDDRLVEQTVYASGASIIVNFSDEERRVEGVTVAPQAHVIL